jgi:CRP-like cAMP-binding protein
MWLYTAGMDFSLTAEQAQLTIEAIENRGVAWLPSAKDVVKRLLKSVSLFSAVSDGHLQNISKALAVKKFEAGDVLFCEGDIGEEFYIIVEGKIDLILGGHHLRDSQRRTDERIKKGDIRKNDTDENRARGMLSLMQQGAPKRDAVQAKKTVEVMQKEAVKNGVEQSEKLTSLGRPRVMTFEQERELRHELEKGVNIPAQVRELDDLAEAAVDLSSSRPGVEAVETAERRLYEGVKIGTMVAPQSFGELSLLDDKAGLRSCTCIAATKSTLVYLSRVNFDFLVRQTHRRALCTVRMTGGPDWAGVG